MQGLRCMGKDAQGQQPKESKPEKFSDQNLSKVLPSRWQRVATSSALEHQIVQVEVIILLSRHLLVAEQNSVCAR